MKHRDDFLRECMSEVNGRLRGINKGPIPMNEFNLINCRLCARRECARSGMNNSMFDRRVDGWKEKLFTNVPRAEDGDHQWDHLRAKRFIAAREPVVEVKSFQDPERASGVQELEQIKDKPVPESKPVPEPELEQIKDKPVPESKPVPEKGLTRPQSDNTPFTQGMVLSKDGQDVTMEPGSTYVFGDD